MIGQIELGLTFAAALGCGLMAGTFFAFSVFVMKALGRLPPAQGIAAMQSINSAVLNRWFLGVFVGTAAACAVLIAITIFRWHESGAVARLAGSLLYLIGGFGLTVIVHVPRNDALARLAPDAPEAAAFWADYLRRWTAWNHGRTIGCLGAGVALVGSLL